jgi:hypothetical protein
MRGCEWMDDDGQRESRAHPNLVPTLDEAVGEVVQVTLHPAHVGEEKVGDEAAPPHPEVVGVGGGWWMVVAAG